MRKIKIAGEASGFAAGGGDPTTIHCDQFTAQPPAVVWKALTEPDLHARWWAKGDVKPVVGHPLHAGYGSWGQQPCQVHLAARAPLPFRRTDPGTRQLH
jgi:hypothetical protein